MILLNQYILIEVNKIEKLTLNKLLKIDKEVMDILPPSYFDGAHLSILFHMAHSKTFKGESYIPINHSYEMKLFSFLKDNISIDINVNNIIKMYQILMNDELASFRKENIRILTGEKFYIPTSKDNIELEMNTLCEKYKYLNQPQERDFDDVFKFILEFICIHPFDNGNGRISAFILQILLNKFNLKAALYLPIDALLHGLYLNRTTLEIRKASGFFYKMKEYQYDSYVDYVKQTVMDSYQLLLESIKNQ